MTQIATVTALPAPGTAEVTIFRQTACGHSCDGCGRCGGRAAKLVVRAAAAIPVEVGDQVELYSDGPVVLFLLGYLLPSGLPEGWRYLCGILGFALGLAGAVACDRRVQRGRTISYQITRKL